VLPGGGVDFRIGGSQVGLEIVEDAAGRAGRQAGEGVEQVGVVDEVFDVVRRVEAGLLVGGGEDLAVVYRVGGAENACAATPGESERGAEVDPVAFVGELRQIVDFARRGDGGGSAGLP
jgi:hypothetical protein